MNETFDLIKIIGMPYQKNLQDVPLKVLENIYDKAFADRVGLLYLELHHKPHWPEKLNNQSPKLTSNWRNWQSCLTNSVRATMLYSNR